MADYKIVLLKGDGIGPEIVNQAVKVLDKASEKFNFTVEYDEALLGGCAIDATGVPLPDETVAKCKAADSVLLGAVGLSGIISRVIIVPKQVFSESEEHSDFLQTFVLLLFLNLLRKHHRLKMKLSAVLSIL